MYLCNGQWVKHIGRWYVVSDASEGTRGGRQRVRSFAYDVRGQCSERYAISYASLYTGTLSNVIDGTVGLLSK